MKILVTGCAGFIGSSLVDQLLKKKLSVVGIDNFNDYYDPKIKDSNLNAAKKNKLFILYRRDILDFENLLQIFKKEQPNRIVHLAARAGVRPSIYDPILYTNVNVLGTANLLKLAVEYKIEQFILGSSSSVYGNLRDLPFSENDPCNKIISPYGASKRASEILVESFFRTYKLKSVILRFFTVYGPRGRPDMAPALFTKAILSGKMIDQFGDGLTSRDYTYIDDIIEGIMKVLTSQLDFEIINLGSNYPVTLKDFILHLEKACNKRAKIRRLPMQNGDLKNTWANIEKAQRLISWQPQISIGQGIRKMIENSRH